MTIGSAAFDDLLKAQPVLEEKCRNLQEDLSQYALIGVAFSGGVDSSFIAWFCSAKLLKPVELFFAAGDFISARERENAFVIATWLGLKIHLLEPDLLRSAAIRNNPVDRCYFCKKEIFSQVLSSARELGCNIVLDGSHAGDHGYRPGKKALSELGVLSPLAAAGLIKEEIRHLSRGAGIPNWNKPSQSCLATRVPYGAPLTRELLSRIEKAEDFLRSLGFLQVRVRCHGDLARIEVEPDTLAAMLLPANREQILKELGDSGFSHITVDLAGFRSGSWDRNLK